MTKLYKKRTYKQEICYCAICNEKFETKKRLSCHCLRCHEITSKEYYNKFLKKPSEGYCTHPNCDKETNFKNFVFGYSLYCSAKCRDTSSLRYNKILETKKEKYGEDMSAIYEKQKNTVENWSDERKEEYSKNLSNGILAAHKNDPTIVERIVATRKITCPDFAERCSIGQLNRTPEQIIEANIKREQFCLEHYGVRYILCVPEIKENNIAHWTTEKRNSANAKATATKYLLGQYTLKTDIKRINKEKYKNRVRKLSEQNAKLYFTQDQLLQRKRAGLEDGMHLDHIVSLEDCYKNNVPEEIASHISNLRLVSWYYNVSKNSKSDMLIEELYELTSRH